MYSICDLISNLCDKTVWFWVQKLRLVNCKIDTKVAILRQAENFYF